MVPRAQFHMKILKYYLPPAFIAAATLNSDIISLAWWFLRFSSISRKNTLISVNFLYYRCCARMQIYGAHWSYSYKEYAAPLINDTLLRRFDAKVSIDHATPLHWFLKIVSNLLQKSIRSSPPEVFATIYACSYWLNFNIVVEEECFLFFHFTASFIDLCFSSLLMPFS